MTSGRPSSADYGLLIALAAIWGSSFIVIKVAVDGIPPATMTAMRLVAAAVFLAVVTRLAGQSMPRGLRTWGLIVMAGIFGAVLPFTLIAWGEEVVDAGLAAILMGGMPLYTLVLAHVFTPDEKLNAAKLIGVLFGFIGLIVLIGPGKLAQLGTDAVRQLGIAAAALCYAVNAVVTKHLIGLPRRALATAVTLAATVTMIPVSLMIDRPWTLRPDAVSLWCTLGLGIVHTAIATLIMLAIVRRQGASFFGQINLLVPVFGVFWAVLILAERPSANAIIALAIILAGTAIARIGMVGRLHYSQSRETRG